MLTKLTDEQKQFKEVIKKEWSNKFITTKSIDLSALKTGIRFCYRKFKYKNPRIFICTDPLNAVLLAKKLGCKTVKTTHYFGLGYDSGWLSFYDYFYRLGIVKSALFKPYKDFISCGAFSYIFMNKAVIAVQPPLYVKRDADKRMHCEIGPAIEFSKGFKSYRWHGVKVPSKLILTPELITKNDILEEKNSEVQRAYMEKLGWDKYLSLADIVLVDKYFDTNTKLHYELYDFKNRNGDLQPRLLKMESPELNDGTRPYYIEPVPPESKNCLTARRWQCDPFRPSIEECNENSSLVFEEER